MRQSVWGAEIWLRSCIQKVIVSAGLHRWGLPTARRPVVSDYYCGEFIPRVVNYTVHRSRVYVPVRALSNISPRVHLQRILHRTGRKTGACATRLEIKSYRSSVPMNSFFRRPFSHFVSFSLSLLHVPSLSLFLSLATLSHLFLFRQTHSCEICSVGYCLCTAPCGDYIHACLRHLEGMIRPSIPIPVWLVIHRSIDRCMCFINFTVTPVMSDAIYMTFGVILHTFTLYVTQKYRFFF